MTRAVPFSLAAILIAWLGLFPETARCQPSTITFGSHEYEIRIRNGSGEPTEMSVSYWNGWHAENWRSSGTQLVPPGGLFVHTVRNFSIGSVPNGPNRIWYIRLWETFPQRRSSRFTDFNNLEWRAAERTKSFSNGNWLTTTTLDLVMLRSVNVVATVRNQTSRSVAIFNNGVTSTVAPGQALPIPLNGMTEHTIWYGCKCGKWHSVLVGRKEIRLLDPTGETHTGYDDR